MADIGKLQNFKLDIFTRFPSKVNCTLWLEGFLAHFMCSNSKCYRTASASATSTPYCVSSSFNFDMAYPWFGLDV